jgi:hypothetical protein
MILSSFMLFYFMESGRRITKREGRLLILIWATFALVSLFVNH